MKYRIMFVIEATDDDEADKVAYSVETHLRDACCHVPVYLIPLEDNGQEFTN